MTDRPHVLLVDDVKEITDVMAVALDAEGFDITVANDGEEAFNILSKPNKIEVIVLDYMMPRLNGLQFLERVSQDPKMHSIKVILCSAAIPNQQEWWYRLGGQSLRSIIKGCVPKPYDGESLSKAIRAALGSAPKPPTKPSFLDEADEEQPMTMPISQGTIRILAVEDDNVFGPAITEKLRSKGYGVGWCMTRKAMREFIPKESTRLPFDILLLDLALPDAFGSEIIRELAQDPRSEGLQIVIITGHLAQGEEATFLKQLGPNASSLVAAILIKPYEWDRLLATIGEVAQKVHKRG